MGILNVTPDSFFDGGAHYDSASALAQALKMVEQGASIIDVGGQSTRPGAREIGVEEELARVIPVIEALHDRVEVVISIDTSHAPVMQAAIQAGAGLVNDVYALRRPGALEVVQQTGVAVCLMHLQGEPLTMQENPKYDDVVKEVTAFLAQRMDACQRAGIARHQIIVDPGIGFGKTVQHNLALVKNLATLASLQAPVLLGASRKSFIGAILDQPVEQRLYGSLAVTAAAVAQGARIIRTHDVGPTMDVIRMLNALSAAA